MPTDVKATLPGGRGPALNREAHREISEGHHECHLGKNCPKNVRCGSWSPCTSAMRYFSVLGGPHLYLAVANLVDSFVVMDRVYPWPTVHHIRSARDVQLVI